MKPDIIATVVAITVICYLVGVICKAIGTIDKWIPAIVGACGAVLGVIGMYTIPDFPAHDILNSIAIGIASGLASTGANQVVRQLSQGRAEEDEDIKIWPDEEDD